MEIGEDAVPALIRSLKDQNQQVRSYAARTLAEIGESAVDALILALQDQNQLVFISDSGQKF